MAIDPSIPLQARGVQLDNPLDTVSKLMTVKQLAMQNQASERQMADDRAIRDIFSRNVKIGANGKPELDRNTALSELYRVNPAKAIDYQKMFQNQDLEQLAATTKAAKEIAWSIYDDQSYQAARQRAIQMGLPNAEKIPEQYMPGFVKNWQMSLLDGEKQLEQMNKNREFGLKDRELGLKHQEIASKNAEKGAKQTNAMTIATELRKERSGLPVTKATQEISAAYNKIQNAAKSPSPAGDMSLIFGYMKILDPGSTVREGEYATAQNATNVPAQTLNLYNRIISGERLNPQQREDFMKQAGGLYRAQLALQRQVDSHYAGYAQKSGIDPRDVLVNFEANNPDASSKPPTVIQNGHTYTLNPQTGEYE